MMLRKAMMCGVLAGGLAVSATMAMAQDNQEEQVLVAGTVDCRYQLRPVETAICSTPVLAAMDIQMITIYNILNLLVNSQVGVVMSADQEVFLKARESCSSDAGCIGEAYAARIGELDAILKDIASRGPY